MKILINKSFLNNRSYAVNQILLSCRWKSTSYESEDYQYIQRSKLPTYHFQPSLPRLPIPELDKTCQRYLASQRPLLNDEEFKKTEDLMMKFAKKEGHELNEELKTIDNKNKHTSYISEPWFDMYLSDRVPLPINYNPVLIFVNDPKPEYNDQLIRATNLLVSSARFMKSIRSKILAPEVFHMNPKKSDTSLFQTVTGLLPSSLSWYGAYLFKAFPLDMSQYVSLFNSTRVPEVGKDRLFRNEDARHVTVMKNGNFYTFDLLDNGGNILPPDEILACMKYILEDKTPATEFPVGALTTGDRDIWAKARQHLESIGNKELLHKIDSSILNAALDNDVIGENQIFMMQNFLHGNGANRWFDKSFSLLVAKDGLSAVNFEHSWGDGVAVLRYFQDIYKDSSEKPQVHPNTKPASCDVESRVTKLVFNLDDKAKQVITEARKKFDAQSLSLDFKTLELPSFGKKLCKKHGVSPDAIMQLGFQAAYHQLEGKAVATYESCSTAAFRHGRTETIRPCTTATKDFCLALSSPNKPSDAELRDMIKKCSVMHGNLTKEAAMGQGFDRHMFGLRLQAAKRGGPMPDVFLDPAYAGINHNILSTSTLSSSAVLAGGFGPVVKDGFGVGYNISDDKLGVMVTSYPPHRSGSDYVQCLKSTFENIYKILISTK